MWPVNRGWRVAPALVWASVVVEVANGILHPLVALIMGRYIAGAVTAPLLLVLPLSWRISCGGEHEGRPDPKRVWRSPLTRG